MTMLSIPDFVLQHWKKIQMKILGWCHTWDNACHHDITSTGFPTVQCHRTFVICVIVNWGRRKMTRLRWYTSQEDTQTYQNF